MGAGPPQPCCLSPKSLKRGEELWTGQWYTTDVGNTIIFMILLLRLIIVVVVIIYSIPKLDIDSIRELVLEQNPYF